VTGIKAEYVDVPEEKYFSVMNANTPAGYQDKYR